MDNNQIISEILKKLPIDNYSEDSFEQLWKLISLSNDSILGINWEEKKLDKIETAMTSLGFEFKQSTNSNIRHFGFTCSTGDIIEGFIFLPPEESISVLYNFGFNKKRANNLISWLEKKFGTSLNLREHMINELQFDWIIEDVLVEAELVKLSKFAGFTLRKWPDYIKLVNSNNAKLSELSKKLTER
jgi:hypothetical protein